MKRYVLLVLVAACAGGNRIGPGPVPVPRIIRDTVRDTVRVQLPPRVDTVKTLRVDTVTTLRVDTVKTLRVDTVKTLRVDTLTKLRVDTVTTLRVDTVTRARVDTVTRVRVDTVTRVRVDTLTKLRVDTVTLTHTDTVRLVHTDTVTLGAMDLTTSARSQYLTDVFRGGIHLGYVGRGGALADPNGPWLAWRRISFTPDSILADRLEYPTKDAAVSALTKPYTGPTYPAPIMPELPRVYMDTKMPPTP